eukprot:c2927_g1_i1 orf=393-1112(-)
MAEEASLQPKKTSIDSASVGGDVELAAAAQHPMEVTEVKGDAPLYMKRRKLAIAACCGSLACFIVLLGIVILSLSLTIFKAKEPVITIEDIELGTLNLPTSLNMSDLHLNFSLQVAVSVYNPNHASFRYSNSTSYMFYRQITVGEASIPAGKIGARATETLQTTLRLNASSSILLEPNLFSDVAAGSFPISTSAQVSGRVNVLNIFKHHAHSSSFCTMSIVIASQSVQNMTCISRVKLS